MDRGADGMSHFDDQVDATTELFLKASLSNKMKELPITGFCWWCNEESKGTFCSPECREDHSKHERFNQGS